MLRWEMVRSVRDLVYINVITDDSLPIEEGEPYVVKNEFFGNLLYVRIWKEEVESQFFINQIARRVIYIHQTK
jgi:hypothetical protein